MRVLDFFWNGLNCWWNVIFLKSSLDWLHVWMVYFLCNFRYKIVSDRRMHSLQFYSMYIWMNSYNHWKIKTLAETKVVGAIGYADVLQLRFPCVWDCTELSIYVMILPKSTQWKRLNVDASDKIFFKYDINIQDAKSKWVNVQGTYVIWFLGIWNMVMRFN